MSSSSSSVTVESQLFDAAWCGDVEEASSLLQTTPCLNVNWTDVHQQCALHCASFYGHVKFVKLLLAHPGINVNLKDREGHTPFSLVCLSGNVQVAYPLLKDPRVDLTLADNSGRTPLWWASWNGHHGVIKWLIASGGDLRDIGLTKGSYEGKEYTALDIARERKRAEVMSVLERFTANPAQTRHKLRVKLKVPEALIAEVFALVVFLCDDLLQLKLALASTTAFHRKAAAALRFFTIVSKLPMELQMILSHRVIRSTKQTILRNDSEAAFKSLAKILLSQR